MQKFNIAQGPAINDPTWVVIDGQRTGSGHLAADAKVVMDGLSRDDALGFALLLNQIYLQGVEAGIARVIADLGDARRIRGGYGPAIKGKIE